ncbi:DUF4268 domain-containing protein [Planctellipticum variicoloris]|uniref:DUF4268 domain-containing protein n=1 Tax=Planctellipticum variicoloris TaxID=3064265 RepID=UPI0030139A1C|nr:DUF4268 domain-containing protein [Planctomycetaceae bacterium SH412]
MLVSRADATFEVGQAIAHKCDRGLPVNFQRLRPSGGLLMAKRDEPVVVDERDDLFRRFYEGLHKKLTADPSLEQRTWVRKRNRYETSSHGTWLNFIVLEGNCRVQIYLERKGDPSCREIFDELLASRVKIEASSRRPLEWKGDDLSKQPTIVMQVDRDELGDEAQWEEVQAAMIAAMIRFDAAMAPYLDRYCTGGVVDLSHNRNAQREAR